MTVKQILDRVTTLYNDIEFVRVPIEGYLRFLDDAINQLILARPDANVKYTTIRLSPGTKQSIPTEGYSLVDMIMNKRIVNVTSGSTVVINSFNTPIDTPPLNSSILNYRPVYQVNRRDMDFFEDWQSKGETTRDHVHDWSFDPKSPRTFWVAPYVGNVTPVYVELAYSEPLLKFSGRNYPTALTLTEEVAISEVFIGAIVAYMLYLCYSTDSTSAIDREVANNYRSDFYQALQLQSSVEVSVAPKTIELPTNTVGVGSAGVQMQ